MGDAETMKWILGHPPKFGWYLCVTNSSHNPEYPSYHSIQLWFNNGKFQSGGGFCGGEGVSWTYPVVAWAPMPEFNMEMYPQDKLE